MRRLCKAAERALLSRIYIDTNWATTLGRLVLCVGDFLYNFQRLLFVDQVFAHVSASPRGCRPSTTGCRQPGNLLGDPWSVLIVRAMIDFGKKPYGKFFAAAQFFVSPDRVVSPLGVETA